MDDLEEAAAAVELVRRQREERAELRLKMEILQVVAVPLCKARHYAAMPTTV
jgi:hypothetical protein